MIPFNWEGESPREPHLNWEGESPREPHLMNNRGKA